MATTLTIQELIQKLANATKTYYGAGGHGKADRNEMACKEYTKQLQEFGATIPTTDELLAMGEFNGEGSR